MSTRWVAFWSLLYAAVLEFVCALFFFAAAVSKWKDADGVGGGLLILTIAVGVAVTGLFLLLRHVWAYAISVGLALWLCVVAGKVVWDYLVLPPLAHGNRGVSFELGLVAGVPALGALIGLMLPPTWREVGLGKGDL